MTDYSQVMGNEDVAGVELLLQIHEEVQYLRLNRHIQRRSRLIGNQHLWIEHHGPRKGDALALAAGEHMRIALVVLGTQPDLLHHRLHALPAFAA